ncbi:alpha/beta hydrolase [Microbacterium sp. RD1]|uniref:alpha/beta hydrolase n=1 Tax=Microbacterium sp. RD1 TaxID=3457313 RepID=UPI003FA5D379
MPLDPFFEERLRVHRRYLIGQRVQALRRRLSDGWRRIRRAGAETPTDAGPRAPRPAADVPSAPAASARARHRRAALAWDRQELRTVGTPGPNVRTSEHIVPVAGFPAVRVRIYDPRPPDAAAGGIPAWLTFFGGAFRIGGLDYPTTDAANRRRAAEASVAVVAVDYALAPEHRFPTQIEQAHAALVWLHENAVDLGIDRERLGVAGTSAGASIAAALTLANRDRSALPIRMQLLEVPVADLTGGHVDLRATRALGIPSILARRELRSVARTYLPRAGDARNPLASPLLAPSLAGLPEALVFTAEYDPLRGDGAAYAARLRADGVDASAVQYLGVTHDVAIFTGVLPAARRWHRDVVAALARLHDVPAVG